ncbi:zinc finger protein Paris-like [Drosophila takahashii]|uniref:zinc finger protein Paris-like n=1 Tax=Drosophila takahashii TaxID=29030 RepID=UPI001CF88DB6|nr:zinc finger protein 891-like [Drosophila takahashii]
MENLCRICMLSSGGMTNIFDGDPGIVDIISHYTGVEVKEGDPFPKTICTLCLKVARNFFETHVKEEFIDEDLLEEEIMIISDCDSVISHSTNGTEKFDSELKKELDLEKDSHQRFSVKNEPIREEDDLSVEEVNSTSVGETDLSDSNDSNEHKRKLIDLSTHKEHRLSQREKSFFQCSHCPEIFLEHDHLQSHVRCHHLQFSCSQCSKSFAKESILRLHILLHKRLEAGNLLKM